MNMIYVGMDVHKDTTVCCLFDPAAERSRQYRTVRVPTSREAIESVLRPLNRQCRVAFEVGLQAQWLAAILRPLCEVLQVADPARIRWLYCDGRKNDVIDARKLATLLYLGQLPTVHLPRAEVSLWRSQIHYRRSVIRRRTQLKNQIRAMLRAAVIRCPVRSPWTRRGRAWLQTLRFGDLRDAMLRRLLGQLDQAEDERKAVEQELDDIAANHPSVARLQSVPGIGPRCAEAVVAYADEVRRFGRSRQFASYFGMTPTLDASARVCRQGGISKRGPSVVRWVLIEAAHQVLRRCPVLRAWFDRCWRGRKDRYKKAVVALGRKVLTVLFALLRDGTTFDPNRVLRPVAAA